MACCAFAVFLIGQMYMAVEAFWRMLGLSKRDPAQEVAACDWYPGMPSAIPARRASLFPQWFGLGKRVGLAACLSVGALLVVALTRPSQQPFDIRAFMADPAHWCHAAL